MKRSVATADLCYVPPSEWRKQKLKKKSIVDEYYRSFAAADVTRDIAHESGRDSFKKLQADFVRRGASLLAFMRDVVTMAPWEAWERGCGNTVINVDEPPFYPKPRSQPCIVCSSMKVLFEHGDFYGSAVYHRGAKLDMLLMLLQCIDFIAGWRGAVISDGEGVDHGVLCVECVKHLAVEGKQHAKEIVLRVESLLRVCKIFHPK